MPDPAGQSRTDLREAVRLFERTADRALEVAAKPRASRAEVDDARHQATFALAAVGLAFKKALKAVRPDADA